VTNAIVKITNHCFCSVDTRESSPMTNVLSGIPQSSVLCSFLFLIRIISLSLVPLGHQHHPILCEQMPI